MFIHPFLLFFVLVALAMVYGVKYRIYHNYLKHDRTLEFREKLGVDWDDLDSYSKSALELLQERKKYDAYIEKKDKKTTETEDNFHTYAEQRILDIAEMRKKRGLKNYL